MNSSRTGAASDVLELAASDDLMRLTCWLSP